MNDSLAKPTAGTVGTLGRRAVAYLVLIAVAVLAVKVVGSIVIGLIVTVLTVAVVIALIAGAIWAFRRL